MCRSSELHPEEIVYYVNRKGTRRAIIFYLILLLTFLLFHLYVSPKLWGTDLPSATKVLVHIAGIGGIVLFSILVLMFLRRLYSKEPYIVVNTYGIYDNASGMWSGSGWIEWSEIADVRLSRYHNLPCVEIVPKKRKCFLQRFNWMERINRSSWLGYPAVALRGPLLPVEPTLLTAQIREYWQNALDT